MRSPARAVESEDGEIISVDSNDIPSYMLPLDDDEDENSNALGMPPPETQEGLAS